METVIAALYSFIAVLFLSNFFKIAQQIRTGSTKVNKYSLVATSSLVLQFASLGIYFYNHDMYYVIMTQIYLLLCMAYIKFFNKKKG